MKKAMCIVLAAALAACTDTNRGYVYEHATCFTYDDFPEEKKLAGRSWEVDSVMLLPTRLQLFDTLLAVLTPQEKEILHFVDLKTGKRVASHLSIGQGPGEVLYPGLVNTSEKVRVADLMSSSVLTYEIPDFLHGQLEHPEKIALSRRTSGDIRMLGDNYIAPSYRDDFLFYVFDSSGNVVDSIGQYPEWKEPVTVMERRAMYEFSFTTNRQDRIAVCYNWASLIDILDEKGHLCRRLQGPLNFTSLFKESRNGRVVSARSVRGNRWDAYVISADCGDEFWVTYSGKSEEDADYGNGIRDILSFGWDGALHIHYQLDKSISSFAVDKAGRKIYAICDQPDVHLEEFVNH